MKPRRTWTEDERAQLDLLLQSGQSLTAIAPKLGRDIHDIYNYSKYYGSVITTARKAGQVRSLIEVARLFGVNKNTPYNWKKRKWLTVKRNRAYASRNGLRPKRPDYLISDEAIQKFIDNYQTWVGWAVECVTDEGWRDYARDVRLNAPGRWLTTKEVAQRFSYTPGTVQMWYERGAIQATKYGSALFFWSADLDGWTPPQLRD